MPSIAKVLQIDGVWECVEILYNKSGPGDFPLGDEANWRVAVDQTVNYDRITHEALEAVVVSASGESVTLTKTLHERPRALVVQGLKELTSRLRWEKEIGGTTIGGVHVSTDDVSQRKISELRTRAEYGEISLPFDFSSNSGWIAMDLAMIQGVDLGVASFVQNCYRAQRIIHSEIDSGIVASSVDVTNHAEWPS